jgi:hypothetical protein
MKVFRYRLQDLPERYHTIAVDRIDAVLDICELWSCSEADITDLAQVEPLSARRPARHREN